MTQLTLRGFEPELEKRLCELADRDRLSLNKAALKLMRRGAGLEASAAGQQPIGDQLKRFSGRMPAADAQTIDQAIQEARDTDEELQD